MQDYTSDISFAAVNSPHLVFIFSQLCHTQPNSSQIQYFLLMSLESYKWNLRRWKWRRAHKKDCCQRVKEIPQDH